MSNKIKLLAILIPFLTLSACQKASSTTSDPQKSVNLKPADKIEIVHFHSTNQCWSCITVGEYALKTIATNFKDEYQQGIVTYQDINVDSPESHSIVNKFQARGSALFVNSIIEGLDHIVEDVTVWRLVSNERQYISYLTSKISDLLGK